MRPPQQCYDAGEFAQVVKYARLKRDLTVLRGCLAEGYPFSLGISLFERSFVKNAEVKRTGIVPMPGQGDREHGGHAVLVVGYDEARRVFIVRNSWGGRWGDGGHFYLPYDFFTHRVAGRSLAWDFWTLRDVD